MTRLTNRLDGKPVHLRLEPAPSPREWLYALAGAVAAAVVGLLFAVQS